MTLVRIIRDWDWPDPLRQTPGGRGVWDGIIFTEQEEPGYDFVLIWDHLVAPVELACDPDRVWAWMHEPPNEFFTRLHLGPCCAARVFTQDENRAGKRHHLTAPVPPWHVDFTYDELRAMRPPAKSKKLSWITSAKRNFAGHRRRLEFLEAIRGRLEFDLRGRGFTPIANKWDGLAPYRYSLAVENHVNPWYWTEKIADCFLAWTMPVYYGCTRITEYFPPESMLIIDIEQPRAAIARIEQALGEDLYSRSIEAIAEARRLVLEKYQFFPAVSARIREWERAHPDPRPRRLRLTQSYGALRDLRFACQDLAGATWRAGLRQARALKHRLLG